MTMIPTNSLYSFTTDLNLHSPNEIKRVIPPVMPTFTSTVGWKNFTECLRIELCNKFPHGRCRMFSVWLFFYMAMNFEGRLESDSLIIKIDGKEAKLRPMQTFHGYKNHFTDHYFLEMELNNETWLLDPSWKQFVHSGNYLDNYRLDYFDAFNRLIMDEYPDIIVSKRTELDEFITNLAETRRLKDFQTADKIKNSIVFWNQAGKSKFTEFEKIISAIACQTDVLQLTYQFYSINDFELFWPILQVASNHPPQSLSDFCKQLSTSSVP